MACPWSCACDPPSSPYQSCLQYKTILGGTTFNEREGKAGGKGRSVLYITDVQLAAIWSKERPVFHRVSQHFCNWLWLHQIKKWSKCCVHYSGIPAMFTLTKKRVNRSFLTKPFWSRWPAIGFIRFCSWTLTSLSPYSQAKKKDSKNPTIFSWHTYTHTNEWDFGSGLSKVSGCRWKSPPTWLVSTGYSAWHFFTDDIF